MHLDDLPEHSHQSVLLLHKLVQRTGESRYSNNEMHSRQQAVQGWNAQPDREQLQHEERWTKEQFGQFNAVDLDDDTLNGTVRGNLHSFVELDNGVHNGTFRSNRHRVAGSNEDLFNSTLRSHQYSSEEIQIP
ncbi:hypothetical protein TELCIR_22809 [Teladorsagia circumcincta]|uniref:Uncharacterized protein n=1 Tax=Teladorsagia circumcincta TaxID=45464 RepID=A0A2G9TE29_TELCI|nr:hypothetical protein TELCIR_22809 [Teladorsagia circumcincta]